MRDDALSTMLLLLTQTLHIRWIFIPFRLGYLEHVPTGNDDSDRWAKWASAISTKNGALAITACRRGILTSWKPGEMCVLFYCNGKSCWYSWFNHGKRSWMHMSFVILKLKWVNCESGKLTEILKTPFFCIFLTLFSRFRWFACIFATISVECFILFDVAPDQEILIPHEHSAISWH